MYNEVAFYMGNLPDIRYPIEVCFSLERYEFAYTASDNFVIYVESKHPLNRKIIVVDAKWYDKIMCACINHMV